MAAVSIVLLLAIFILHFKTIFLCGLFTGQWQGAGDVTLMYYPARFFFGNSLRIGEFPLWNNNMFLGFPIHAEGQGGFFYPPNILFAIFPQWIAYNYVFIMHIFLGGFFMYLFAREIKLKKMPSVLVSFVFIFSGFFACHSEHINLLNACVWIPIGFLFVLRKKYLLISLVFALQLLTGFPQIALYTAIILFSWLIFNWKFFSITQSRMRDKNPRTQERLLIYTIWLKDVLKFAVASIFSIVIAFCQVLPTLELIPNTVRNKGVILSDMFSWGYYLKDLLLFICPYIFGNPICGTYTRSDSILFENCAFVGIMTILLTIVGLLWSKEKRFVRFFSILFFTILGFLLFFPVILKVVVHIPIFNFFRLPQRFLVFVVLALAVIAGYGFQLLKKYRLAVFFVIFFELLIFGYGYNNVLSMDYFSTPLVAKFLKHDNENSRALIIDEGQKACIKNYVLSTHPAINYFSQREYLNYLPPNIGICFNIPMLNVYSPLSFVRDSELLSLAKKNAKYILSNNNLNDKNFTPIDEIKLSFGFSCLKVYKNKNYIARALLINDKNKKETFPLTVMEYGNQKIKIANNQCRGGKLIFSDVNYPGWNVFVDGIKTKIDATDALTRCVSIKPFSKKIIFVYNSLLFVVGVMVTIISFFVIAYDLKKSVKLA